MPSSRIAALSPRTTPPPLPKVMPPRRQAPVAAPVIPEAASGQPGRTHSILRRALLGLAAIVVLTIGSAWLLDASIDQGEDAVAAPADGRIKLGSVSSWAHQLQRIDLGAIGASNDDLVVIDTALAGFVSDEATEDALARLQRKSDGSRRLVLSYLSVGEAEDFRSYWLPDWVVSDSREATGGRLAGFTTVGSAPARARPRFRKEEHGGSPLSSPSASAPVWLGVENSEWRGNYAVRYWHPDWKALIFGRPEAALDRIIAAGFDGVYLDRVDIYNLWRSEQPSAKAEMVDLVVEIASYARRKKPGFLVVLQNADELLANPRVRRVLDGVAKEDLLYGVEGEGRENGAADIQSSLRYLRQARSEGLPVLAVEHLGEQGLIAGARDRLGKEGFVATFTPRLSGSSSPGH